MAAEEKAVAEGTELEVRVVAREGFEAALTEVMTFVGALVALAMEAVGMKVERGVREAVGEGVEKEAAAKGTEERVGLGRATVAMVRVVRMVEAKEVA